MSTLNRIVALMAKAAAVAGITFIAEAHAVASGSPTVNKPTGTVLGDIMIYFASANNTNNWTAPAGWVLIFGTTGNANACFKIATASEPSSYAFGTGAATSSSGCIATFRNCYLDKLGAGVGTSGTSVAAPAVSPSTAADMLIGCFGATGPVSFTTPSGMTLVYTSSTNTGLGVFRELLSASGTTGTRTANTVGGSSSLTAGLIALAPQPDSDPSWSGVIALLHFNGPVNGSAIDNSPLGLGYVMVSASLSSSNTKWGNTTGTFGLTGSICGTASPLTTVGSGEDYTAEGWFRPTDVTTLNIWMLHGTIASTGYELYCQSGELLLYGNGAAIVSTSGLSLTTGAYYYVGVTKSAAGIWKIWVNGTNVATSSTVAISIAGAFQVGSASPYGYRGSACDVRVTKGVIRNCSVLPTLPFPNR